MADYPYTPAPSNIKSFFEKIQSIGTPTKVTIKYLASIGFKSSNARYFIPLLKSLGFVDASGAPTPTWQQYRSKKASKQVMRDAIKTIYSDLFSVYPDAFSQDKSVLKDFFRSNTTLSDSTLDFVVRTFQQLCELAGFSSNDAGSKVQHEETEVRKIDSATSQTSSRKGLAINVNIELQLPATTDKDVYDKLFESLKKHLLDS